MGWRPVPEYQMEKLEKADEMIKVLQDIRNELIMVNAKLDNIKKELK